VVFRTQIVRFEGKRKKNCTPVCASVRDRGFCRYLIVRAFVARSAAPAAVLLVVDVVLVVVAGVDGGVEVLLAAVRLVEVRRDGVAGVAGVAVREVVVAATVNMVHGVVRVHDGLARVRVVLVRLDQRLVRLHGDQHVRRDRPDLRRGTRRRGAARLGGGSGHRGGFLG